MSNALQLEPLSLTPIDASAESESPRAPAEVAAPAAAEPTREELAAFHATALREFESGWIDRPLWTSVIAQCKGDEAQAKEAYLKTRATVLQIEKRDARPPAAPRKIAAQPSHPHDVPTARRARRPMPNGRVIAAGAGAIALLAVGIGYAIHVSNDTVDAATGATAVQAPSRRAGVAKVDAAKVAAAAAAEAAAADDGLQARIASTVAAGNWNVVTLLASEWTRREPTNAQAWLQLGDGYLRLKQLPEALDAATRVTQLAPSDARGWRMLGTVYLRLDRPVDALPALDNAVTLDATDLQSLVDLGTLNVQSGRLPEAKAAFERVLAANPVDVDAACGQAYIARQQGQAREADQIERGMQSRDQSCSAWNERIRAVNVASGRTVYKAVPVSVR
jgi:cytochrome c-type biogenesis protein CcmH/NrfG